LYNAERDKINNIFKEAIPYFKKAVELKPDDIDYKRNLRSLYYRLQMDKEAAEIDEEIKAMENN
ncbi:MAG TPA: hypothetical protein P5236_04175, partial [Paludibacteraceae bacterium]|nr:hypothetical protein [Paludibacteraceae bacterium]